MLSSVAGILGPTGHLRRVVVAELVSLPLHIQPGEKLVVLPDLLVQEPLAWGVGLNLVEHVKRHIAEKVSA